MAITTNCSGCGKTLAVADEFAGRQARCPACGQIYTVPGSTAQAPGSLGNLNETNAYTNPAPLDLGAPMQPSSSPLAPVPLAPINEPSPNAASGSGSSASDIQYWMRATNGAEYGPADSATLNRWFTEGRVGADYQIRIGQFGHWQPAAGFQSLVGAPTSMPATGTNPYAAHTTFTAGVATGRTYPKADQSGLVLAMGILAWIGGCPIFGIIAWVIGAQAISDMNKGLADPSSRGVLQVGYYLGMINVIICVACGGLGLLSVILSAMFN